MSPQPLVTVIVCVFNAGDFLRPALLSLLNQTYSNLEIIVVDDGSTDGCFEHVADLVDSRLSIMRQRNLGKPAAMNEAMRRMHGAYYAINDADDISHPDRIAHQLDCLIRNPQAAGVFCGFDLILNDRRIAPVFSPKDAAQCALDISRMEMPGHDPTAMYRVHHVRNIQYDESLPIVEGYDYVLRVGEQFPLLVLGECLYSYRVHWNTVTKRDPTRRCRMLRLAMERTFERRRLPIDLDMLPPTPEPSRIPNRQRDNDLVSHFMVSVLDQRHGGNWKTALATALACLALHPADPYYYKPLAYALAPLCLVDVYRARKAASLLARESASLQGSARA
jgi:glycosyltransferase involved in cell wall biosynthesis